MYKKIFVVDNEKKIRNIIKIYLENEKYQVSTFESGEQLLKAFYDEVPDMIIIDIMLPGIDGLEVCKLIRKISDVPIIIVSAKDDTFDKILGIELGSDDYLVKPFSPRELVVRVKNIFRRIDKIEKKIDKTLNIMDIEVLIDERVIKKNNNIINLTTKEFDLFVFLAKNINKVFNRAQLIDKVWGYDFIAETRLVDDVIKRIRKKLKENKCELEIITVWGYGYKIEGGE